MWAQGTWRTGTWLAGVWESTLPEDAAVPAARVSRANLQSGARANESGARRTNVYLFSRMPAASAVREDELPPQRCVAASADRPAPTSASRTTAAPRSIRHNLSTGRRT